MRDGDGWRICDWRRDGEGQRGASGWTRRGETAWPYAHGPLVDWPHDTATDAYYGVGEAVNLALNDRVNKVAGDIARILRFHASPRTVGIGFEAGDVTPTAIDTFWTIANPEAKVFNLEMSSDLASSMSFLDFCARSFLAERRVVMLRGELTDLRHVTNLGIRALFMDQIGRTLELRRNYEAGIAALCRRMLALGGFLDAAEGHIALNWPDALPVDTGEAVAVLERERALGILSKETAARARGYDWQVEKERLEGEAQTTPTSPRRGSA
ncbi:MAG: hypothetical protein IT323_04690 [Anaerolineae bacterium]|nr:hypothetical protein [Anaerolineae bacterium]